MIRPPSRLRRLCSRATKLTCRIVGRGSLFILFYFGCRVFFAIAGQQFYRHGISSTCHEVKLGPSGNTTYAEVQDYGRFCAHRCNVGPLKVSHPYANHPTRQRRMTYCPRAPMAPQSPAAPRQCGPVDHGQQLMKDGLRRTGFGFDGC